jgi:3-hydroxyisobutyrate dehydrogenase
MAKVAFIGLGVMGYPMAAHLKHRGGHDLTVYNRSETKAEKWVDEHGGARAATPREAAGGADFVFSCVGNDDDLREVTTGEHGAFHAMKPDAIYVDNTTASAEVARELAAEAKARGFHFLDAPVSGGQAGAENGVLAVMCGGDESVFGRAKPIIEAFGKTVRLIGPSGSGQLTKMVNQICIAGLVQGLAEAMNFAKKAGLDVDKVVEVVAGGAAGSWQLQNRYRTMVDGKYDFGFAVDWMRKDLGICFEEAARNGAKLPVTEIVDHFYAEIQDMGGGRWDTSSLMARLER